MKDKRKIVVLFIFFVIVGLIVFSKNIFGKSEKSDTDFLEQVVVEDNKVEENELKDEKIKVHIVGEVNKPGLVELDVGSRIYDAIELAGGITNNADISKTNLAYILSDGEKIYIPNFEDDDNVSGIVQTNSNIKININTAKLGDLKNIPGVGDSTANSIIEYREKNGKFILIEDIQNVSGIGQSKFEKMKEYITVK